MLGADTSILDDSRAQAGAAAENDSVARRPRVVLVQTQAEGAGAQEVARILGNGLKAKGYDVHYVFFFRRTAAFDRQPNTFFCSLRRPGDVASLMRMFRTLVGHLHELRPDAVVCFQHYGNIVGAMAAWLANAHVVITNRTTAKSLVPWWARAIDLLLGSVGLFRAVVVNSKAIEDEYRGYPSWYRSRVHRIDHGFEAKHTDLDRAGARDALQLPPDAPLLGCVARLHPGKNLEAAIRLLLLEPDWHLALAGQGPAHADLISFASSLGVADRVHFVGELSPEQVAVFLRSLDVFVFPSRAESFGLAPVEAAEAGVPVVANDLAVLREVLAVKGQSCALFADADDTGQFADAVRTLLADDELRATLSARGKKLAQRYSLDAMVVQFASLIASTTRTAAKGR
jgi:glycosyltransferase involved in cell wall biosynthesis